MAAPPDLRVLCRRLASTPLDELPRLSPVLIGHVLRCGGPLSASTDAKDKASETSMLVHKLRTHITSLLNGKNASGRFSAVCLVKAVIDVGGWESLRASDPWIKGLIGLLQKPDPISSKELCIVTLTKIYMLLHGYQTLVREMATPTLQSYATACLQLIKPPASGRPLKVPAAFVDTVICSLSKLVMLYPTTMRPCAAQIKAAIRPYLAPTSSDPLTVPHTLRSSSRRLFVLLSYTAPKNGSSEEWAKSIRPSILDCHATADQVFRAVVESWESTTGYRSQPTHTPMDPSGGGDSPDELPPWTGVQAGSERLIGLLELLAEFFDAPTKAPVTVPLGELLDLTTRITLVTPPSSFSEDSIQTNPAIERDEKAELWSVLPDVHIAVLRLHAAILRRLGENALPLATDLIDQMVRVCNASHHIASMRETCYMLTKELLLLAGPTLQKLTVTSLTPLIQAACRDILLAAGHPDSNTTNNNNNNNNNPQQTQPVANGTKNKQHPQQKQQLASTNADAYLSLSTSTSSSNLNPLFFSTENRNKTAAHTLLPCLFSYLPQAGSHLAPETRALLDRTAIRSRHRDAMLAACLHPYRDTRGRYYPSILPFLVRAFPQDQAVEVVRSNLLRAGFGAGSTRMRVGVWDNNDDDDGLIGGDGEVGDGDGDKSGNRRGSLMEGQGDVVAAVAPGFGPSTAATGKVVVGGWGFGMDVDADGGGQSATTMAKSANPFATVTVQTVRQWAEEESLPLPRPASPLKRKSDQFDAGNPPKRVDTGKAAEQPRQVAVVSTTTVAAEKGDGESGSESDSEGSVQIDMTLDDEEEEEEDEEGEEDGDE